MRTTQTAVVLQLLFYILIAGPHASNALAIGRTLKEGDSSTAIVLSGESSLPIKLPPAESLEFLHPVKTNAESSLPAASDKTLQHVLTRRGRGAKGRAPPKKSAPASKPKQARAANGGKSSKRPAARGKAPKTVKSKASKRAAKQPSKRAASKGPKRSASKGSKRSASKGPKRSASKGSKKRSGPQGPKRSASKGPKRSASKGSKKRSASKGSKRPASKGPKRSASKGSKKRSGPKGPKRSASKGSKRSASKGKRSASKRPKRAASKGSRRSTTKGPKRSAAKRAPKRSGGKPKAAMKRGAKNSRAPKRGAAKGRPGKKRNATKGRSPKRSNKMKSSSKRSKPSGRNTSKRPRSAKTSKGKSSKRAKKSGASKKSRSPKGLGAAKGAAKKSSRAKSMDWNKLDATAGMVCRRSGEGGTCSIAEPPSAPGGGGYNSDEEKAPATPAQADASTPPPSSSEQAEAWANGLQGKDKNKYDKYMEHVQYNPADPANGGHHYTPEQLQHVNQQRNDVKVNYVGNGVARLQWSEPVQLTEKQKKSGKTPGKPRTKDKTVFLAPGKYGDLEISATDGWTAEQANDAFRQARHEGMHVNPQQTKFQSHTIEVPGKQPVAMTGEWVGGHGTSYPDVPRGQQGQNVDLRQPAASGESSA
ncbi:hypothetical protein HDU67_005056 [Dinochytrium kinnereticum]|nr:hypothetical protein HDU67_005056 [Dinochytrium kinnereticum]